MPIQVGDVLGIYGGFALVLAITARGNIVVRDGGWDGAMRALTADERRDALPLGPLTEWHRVAALIPALSV